MPDRLFTVIAQVDAHFHAADVSPPDAAYWAELMRRIVHMKDGLDLARRELDSGLPDAEKLRKVLKHVRFALGERGGK